MATIRSSISRCRTSPKTPVALVDAQDLSRALEKSPGALCVLSTDPPDADAVKTHWIEMPRDPERYARTLYDSLRSADRVGADRILVALPGTGPEWAAILDRLTRAGQGGKTG